MGVDARLRPGAVVVSTASSTLKDFSDSNLDFSQGRNKFRNHCQRKKIVGNLGYYETQGTVKFR